MKKHLHVGTVLVAALTLLSGAASRVQAEEGVAVGIVYDTSGSMKDPVRDATGKLSPKYKIANKALEAIIAQFETYAASGGGRKVEAGLFIFNGNGARAAVPFGPLNAKAMKDWVARYNSPQSGTPLGTALQTAGRAVLASKLSRKHVLVVTDGMNTLGPDPAQTLPPLKQEFSRAGGQSLSVHFVAFDVAAGVFDGVKKQGATVVGAADERQLHSQLEFILQHKILLEDEEPPKKN
jgi:hypothetical protein